MRLSDLASAWGGFRVLLVARESHERAAKWPQPNSWRPLLDTIGSRPPHATSPEKGRSQRRAAAWIWMMCYVYDAFCHCFSGTRALSHSYF